MKRLTPLFLFLFFVTSYGQNSPQIPISNSNWVATDGLGRVVSNYASVGNTKANKYVGVFYYIWQGSHGNALYDNTKLLAANPTNPAYGPAGAFHWGGESEAGYYKAIDRWVIRRNLQMLTDAGVDFIFFDLTNAFTYLNVIDTLCKVSLQMRSEGINTPYFACTLHAKAGITANAIYDNIYKLNKYSSLWFYWAGKPLLLTDTTDTAIRPEVKSFFTRKHCWAWTDQTKPNSWQWLDTYPQTCGWSVKSTDHEQITVSVAQHPTSNRGDSYSGGVEPPHNQYGLTTKTGEGIQFAEQWKRVFELNPTPTIVMVTQWNEWMAQRFVIAAGQTQTFLGQTLTAGQTFFVDVYNQEYNRDMEPMKNGHTDNKYYQLVDNVRKYKGMPAPQASSASKTISIDGVFSEWTTVTPIFKDPRGDTYHRNEAGYASGTTYVNATGRNDIIESRAAVDASNVYFYVKTNENLTPSTDPNWMLLFIDADKNRSTGWAGFDYVVNTSVVNATTTTLKKWNGTTSSWDFVANINYRYAQNQLELAIPRDLAGFITNNVGFHYQWADNTQTITQAAFSTNGDAAPDRRFRYDYTNTVPYIITGISDPAITEDNLSYPNPFNDQITIALTTDAEVQLIDMTGKMVFKNRNVSTINTSELSQGIYLLRIITSTDVKEVKMEKQ